MSKFTKIRTGAIARVPTQTGQTPGPLSGNFIIDRFSGDGVTTDFVLSIAPGSENNTFVYISGVYQQKDTYSVNLKTLSFSAAPPTGTNNIEVIMGQAIPFAVPSNGTVTTGMIADGAITDAKIGTTKPLITTYTSGSGTHVLNAATRWIRVRMVGGGGGGGGGGVNGTATDGTPGNPTSFGTLIAGAGAQGYAGNAGVGTGGTNTFSGTGIQIPGGSGASGHYQGGGVDTRLSGGNGGASALGGEGFGGFQANGGGPGAANSGSGGGGGGTSSSGASVCVSGGGGGSGGYIEAIIKTIKFK